MLFLKGKKTFPESTKCSVEVEGAIKVTAPDIILHLREYLQYTTVFSRLLCWVYIISLALGKASKLQR